MSHDPLVQMAHYGGGRRTLYYQHDCYAKRGNVLSGHQK